MAGDTGVGTPQPPDAPPGAQPEPPDVPGPPPGPPVGPPIGPPVGPPPATPGLLHAGTPLPPGQQPPGAPPATPASARHRAPRQRPGFFSLLAVAVVAALVGAGAALAVARVTGWGRSTVVHERTGTTVDIGQVLSRVLPSVVSVSATVTALTPTTPFQGTATALGTGVVVSKSGEVVTNDHVVSGASSVEVTLNGAAKPLPATVVGESPGHDLALVKIDEPVTLTPATFSTSSHVGDAVVAIGYALGLTGGPSVTEGIISATGRTVTTETRSGTPVVLHDMIQTDAAISSGNSGGPLVDLHGHVLGINTVVAVSSTTATAEDIGFAIPAATIQQVIENLRG